MGQSTNGELWYGFVFEDGYEFPWDAAPFEGDIDDWWLAESGFKPSVEIYDAADPSGYKGGAKPTEEAISDYYAEKRNFKEAHPCPVETVNYCSGDYPMYALAVCGTGMTAYRGDPKRVEGLGISPQEIAPLLEFCEKYNLKPEGESGWYLSSYWG